MENLVFALEVMVLGFVLVMLTLFLLFLIILFIGKIFGLKEDSYKDKVISIEEADFPGFQFQSSKKNAGKVAAITAALAVYLYDSDKEYTIKKIEPAYEQFTGKWALQGRKELLNMGKELEKLRREKSGKKIFQSYRRW